MARARYGPRDGEYTLQLQDSESILLLGLLQNEIERYEQKQTLSEMERIACDTFQQIYRALLGAHQTEIAMTPPHSRWPN